MTAALGAPESWVYSEDIPAHRQVELFRSQAFEETVDVVLRNVAEVQPHPDRMRDLERPTFLVRLNGGAADLFFNGSAGYRAAFCRSTSAGEAATRLMIDALLPLLMVHGRAFWSHSSDWTERSLRDPAAKTWIWERGLAPLGFPWIAPKYEVLYPVWVRAAETYLRDKVDMPQLLGEPRDRMADRLSFWGVRAPESEWIEVKGSWMAGDAPVPSKKPTRSEEIKDWGWT